MSNTPLYALIRSMTNPDSRVTSMLVAANTMPSRCQRRMCAARAATIAPVATSPILTPTIKPSLTTRTPVTITIANPAQLRSVRHHFDLSL